MVTLWVNWKSNSTDSWATGNIGTLPVDCRPARDTYQTVPASNSGRPVSVKIDKDGKVTWGNQGGAQEAQPFACTFAFPSI